MTPAAASQAPIRALVGRFSFPFSERSLEAALAVRPFAFLGLISTGEPRFYEAVARENQEWFSSSEIRNAEYAGTDWTSLAPLDEELIEKMRPCEALFLETVCRLEWKHAISYATRKSWYLKHLRFWNDYLERRKINLYLSAWLPHEIPDVVIYSLCKLKNIPVLYFHSSSVRDISFPEHDLEHSAEGICARYEELLKEYANVRDPAQIPLGEAFTARYDALTTKAGQKPPLESLKRSGYWKQVRSLLWKKPLSGIRFVAGYCTPSGIRRAVEGIRRWRAIHERDAFYDAHAVNPDLSVPFVYMPLHFQPEASTVPMGGVYGDQLLIAALLNAALPDDVLIYVKEHPRASSWLGRTTQMYRDLLDMKKVRFIRRSADTFALRERCAAVATATGTAGFEGLFRGKPVFLFGHRFYQYARGVFRIRTRADLESAVKAVFTQKQMPSLVESRLYLKAMEDTGVRGTLNPWHLKVSHLTEDEHVKANAAAILEEISTLHP